MTRMEWFGNIGGGKFNNDLFCSFGGVIDIFQTEEFVLSKSLLILEDRGD